MLSTFNNITIDILKSTLAQSYDVSSRWNAYNYPFYVLFFCIALLGLYSFLKFKDLYSEILLFHSFIEKEWLERDIERYKILINLVNQDRNVIFKYNFDLESKEKFLKMEEKRKENH